jgi:hypothetical protein
VGATATVTVVDGNGTPVRSARVYGTWTGAASGSQNALTGRDGTVRFQSSLVKSGGTFTFTVSNVVKSGYTYQSGSNSTTSNSIAVNAVR